MTAQENADRLELLPDSFPYQAQQSVTTHFETLGDEIRNQILGEGHGANQPLQELINLVMQRSSDTYNAMEQLQTAIRDAATRLRQS